MNIKKIIPILFIGSMLFLSACNKDTDVFVPDPGQVTGADTNWVASITSTMPVSVLQNNLLLETYKDSMEVNANIATVTSPAGLICTFPPLCCQRSNGTDVTGRVYVELMLIKNKGDMIRMEKPTTSNGRLLVSGGEVFVKLKKDGEDLHLKPGMLFQVKYPDPLPSPLMKVFYGDESNPNLFNWTPDSAGTASQVFAGNQFYQFYSRSLRWLNCDYFYDTTGGATRVKVQTELPSHFTNANTSVYMVFNDMKTVVNMYGEFSIKKFVSGKVPTGKTVTLVVISKQGNDYYLGRETAVTGLNVTGSANQNVKVTPVKTPLADIKSYLGTL